MSSSEYKSHPLWAQVNQILQWQELQNFVDPAIFSTEQNAFARDKVFSTAKVIKELLKKTPATLASLPGLNQIHGQLQNSVNEMSNFISNNNPGHLINAASHIDDSVMPTMWAFFPRLQNLSPQIDLDLIQQVRNSAAGTVDFINGLRTSVSSELDQLRDEISQQKNQVAQLIDTLSIQRNEAMAVNAKVQQEFAEAETKRSAVFNEKISEISDEAESTRNQLSNNAKNSLDSLSQNEMDARRIVQVVGNIGVTGNFQKIATSETKQANLWRWITVELFSLGIIFAIITFYKFLNTELTPEHAWSAVIRLLYAIAITAPAWYAAKESARHRTNADTARKTELELASLGPFIELMPEDKKVAIREALVEKYFGNGVKPHEIEPAGAELREFILDAIKVMKK